MHAWALPHRISCGPVRDAVDRLGVRRRRAVKGAGAAAGVQRDGRAPTGCVARPRAPLGQAGATLHVRYSVRYSEYSQRVHCAPLPLQCAAQREGKNRCEGTSWYYEYSQSEPRVLTVGTLSTHSARRDRAGNGAATALLYSPVLKVGTLFLEGLRGEAVLAMELPKRHATSLVGSQSGYSEYSQWALTVGPQRTHSGYSEL